MVTHDSTLYSSITAVMFRYIEILSALFCLLLLYQNVNSKSCPPGQKKNYNTNKCEDCPEDQYKSDFTPQITCNHCTKCKEGSEIESQCSPTRDTRCKCKKGFTPIDLIKETLCICQVGYGQDRSGQKCTICNYGFFSDKQNSACQKWKECKSGIRIPGNNTSDAFCNALEEGPEVHTIISTSPPMTTTTFYIAPSSTTSSSSIKKDYSLWLILLCTVGVLLLMGLLYRRCTMTHCILNNTKMISRKESACKRPVEESGEKCHSLLV